jgi:branched-chain amino acid transport system substrate-binding protein
MAVQNADGSISIPRQALTKAMLPTKDMQGVTGNLTCSPTGDCADPKVPVYETFDTKPASWNPGAGADNNLRKVWPKE